VGKTKRGKGSKILAIADRQGRPVAVHVESATPHEVTFMRWLLGAISHAFSCATNYGAWRTRT
jgi:hypothetical protein